MGGQEVRGSCCKMRAWVHGQWGDGQSLAAWICDSAAQPSPLCPAAALFFLQASSRRAAGGRLGSTHLSTCCTHGLLACCCRHVPPIQMMPSATWSRADVTVGCPNERLSDRDLMYYLELVILEPPARSNISDDIASQPDLPPSDCSLSDWTSQTPSVLNRPSSLIPSESPPPPPISPSSPAESTAKVRVHPSACFHIPHPTLNPLRATTTHRAAAPFPLSSPLARADAD